MSDTEKLESAAMRLLDALGVEEAWNICCADAHEGRETICPFPEDFDEDTVYDEIRVAKSELLSLVLDSRFTRNYPDVAAMFDRLDPRQSNG